MPKKAALYGIALWAIALLACSSGETPVGPRPNPPVPPVVPPPPPAPQPVVIGGRAYPVGDSPILGLRAYFTGSSVEDSVNLGSDGSFSFSLYPEGISSVERLIAAPESPYLPSLATVPSMDFGKRELFPLIPRVWNTLYKGEWVEHQVNLDYAYTPTNSATDWGSYFLGRHIVSGNNTWDYAVWETFPVEVAFDRENSNLPITAEDSLIFEERSIRRGNEMLGMGEVFRLVDPSRMTLPGWKGIRVRLHTNNGRSQALVSHHSTDRGTFINGARVTYSDRVWLHSLSTGPHELIHALGIGHGSGEDLMSPANRDGSPKYEELSVESTALIQMLYAAAKEAQASRASLACGFAYAHQGQRGEVNPGLACYRRFQ